MTVTVSTELAETILAQLMRRLPDEDAAQAMVALQTALGHQQKEETMALNIDSIKSELDAVVSQAADVADLADKYADVLVKYADLIPGAGAEVRTLVGYLDTATKALDELKSALASI